MVTSYYIMKMCKARNNTELSDHFANLHKTRPNVKTLSCRICLQDGCISLYGKDNSSVIRERLQQLCDIEIDENDNNPKYLCSNCYKFIKDSISFKQLAKQTESVLKQSVKQELKLDDSQDIHDFTDYEEKEHNYIIPPDNIPDTKPVRSKNNVGLKVQCNICNKIVNKSYYKEHMTMHDPNHFKYVCDVCGKSFRLRCAYHNHSLRHRTDFPYKCQFCPYKGRYAELLKNHMKVHIGDYRYMCTECPARFLFKSNLNRHMLRHKEPQHSCETCKRSFHTKLYLQRHYEADHLGIRNHVCGLCGKAFGYRNAMMKHQRNVHKREKLMFSRMPSYLLGESHG
ncbi:zinc finger protein 567-like [Colias croceus]|uniref:zinc finger protein 567-like n=1 Tax=Colias crocea TaxID=72248 RepID=UPI001E27CCA3|nr:zinc finger protein 567-like [Colias croceus]